MTHDSTSEYISEKPKPKCARTCAPYVHCSVTYKSRDVGAAQVFVNRQMDGEDAVHADNGILLSRKEYDLLPLRQHGRAWRAVLSTVSQAEGDKSHMISLKCAI